MFETNSFVALFQVGVAVSEAEDVLALLTGLMIARRTTTKDATNLSTSSDDNSSSSSSDSLKSSSSILANGGDSATQAATVLATPPRSASAANVKTASNTSATSHSLETNENTEDAVDLGLSPEEVKGYQLRTAQCRAHEIRSLADTPPSQQSSARLRDEQQHRELSHDEAVQLPRVSPGQNVSRRLHLDTAHAYHAPPSRYSLVFWAVVYFFTASVLAAGIGYGVFLHMLYTNGGFHHLQQYPPDAHSARPVPSSWTTEEHFGPSERRTENPAVASLQSAMSSAAVPPAIDRLESHASISFAEQYSVVAEQQENRDAEVDIVEGVIEDRVEEEEIERELQQGMEEVETDSNEVEEDRNEKQQLISNAEGRVEDDDEVKQAEEEMEEEEPQQERAWNAEASSVEVEVLEGEPDQARLYQQQEANIVPSESKAGFTAEVAVQVSTEDDDSRLALEVERVNSNPSTPSNTAEAEDSTVEDESELAHSAKVSFDEMGVFEARKREAQLLRDAEIALPHESTSLISNQVPPAVAQDVAQDTPIATVDDTASADSSVDEEPADLLPPVLPQKPAPAPTRAHRRSSKPDRIYPTGFQELEAEMAEMLEADRREREAEVVGGAEQEDGKEEELGGQPYDDATGVVEDDADASDSACENGSGSTCAVQSEPASSLSPPALVGNTAPNKAGVEDSHEGRKLANSNGGASAAAAPSSPPSSPPSPLHVGPIAPDDRERQAAARAAAAEARALALREEQERQEARAARHEARRKEAEAQGAREKGAEALS